MGFNWLVVILTGFVPLLVGFLWYNPKTFAPVWMRESGMTEESMKGANMGVIFGLTLLLGILMSSVTTQMVIHQSHYYSILANVPEMKDPNSSISQSTTAFMNTYGREFRTFKHGAFHGLLYTLFLVLPVVGITAMFERRSWTYIWIHVGYYAVTLMLMGGIISQFA